LSSWDVYGLGYSTSLRIDVPRLWAANPDLTLLSLSLRSALSAPPLSTYGSIALVAHSMGGLVAQHAMLDGPTATRVTTLTLFGTPSNGLVKSLFGRFFSAQARDMAIGSDFVTGLRTTWTRLYGGTHHFVLRVVAGERDQFVPPESSLAPFPDNVQRVVPGNHLEIVKPMSAQDRSVQLLIDTLLGDRPARDVVDSALVAVERRRFAEAVQTLLPRVAELDAVALVQLALALEGVGRQDEALAILEKYYRGGTSSTDALGVLGGRLKRRWIVSRAASDWQRAVALYTEGLQRSAPDGIATEGAIAQGSGRSADQAMYHAINLAFLELMATPDSEPVPAAARELARRASTYASMAKAHRAAMGQTRPDHWQLATDGDALAIEGRLAEACERYSEARAAAERPRDIDSMYGQAVLIAQRMYGEDGMQQVERAFAVAPLMLEPELRPPGETRVAEKGARL
jgi:pimeloyl-ACP methyl ester carboxylesterase